MLFPIAIAKVPSNVLNAPNGVIDGWSVPRGHGIFFSTEYLAIAFSSIATWQSSILKSNLEPFFDWFLKIICVKTPITA